MVELVPVGFYVIYPIGIKPPFVPANRFSVFVQVAPAHKFLYILDLDIIGGKGFYIPKQMFGKGAAICVAGLAAFGTAEIGTFKRSPKYNFRHRVHSAHFGRMFFQWAQVQSSHIFRIVLRFGVVGRVARYGVRVVVYASYNLRAFMPLIVGLLYACTCSACTAKQVYI